jgi:archaellum component FlaC
MAKKSVTIDDLAVMVQKGFADVATKSDIKVLTERFDLVDKRFDKIENLILVDHKKRIERLEEEVKDLKELFAM